jgi:RNA polymerase sigma factor (sigma-70 family)
MKDLLAVTKFKNLRLYNYVRQSESSIANVAASIGVSVNVFQGLLTLRVSPVSYKKKGYTETARKVALYFGEPVEELFPESLYSLRLPRELLRGYDSEMILPLLAASQERVMPQIEEHMEHEQAVAEIQEILPGALATLTPREERIIKMRYGLDGNDPHTLERIGEKFALNRERVRQIEMKAIRKLRQPSRARPLRQLL